MHYDIFNGDADGIIALLQLRKAVPRKTKLITGVKRDVELLEKVVAQNDVSGATVLDISMEKNIDSLYQLIERNIPIFYCDHHRAGEVPQADNFTALINLNTDVCTSWLINCHLGGRYVEWAIVGVFGDNLFSTAEKLAKEHSLNACDVAFLKELGTLINYNGYGSNLSDLHIKPEEVFLQLMQYSSPFELREDISSLYWVLKKGYGQDIQKLDELTPIHSCPEAEVYELPSEAWARRISGVFGNKLANQSQDKAHAVLTLNPNGEDYTVSVRAPLSNRTGADEICIQYPTGGGRKAAAGINQLPKSEVNSFLQTLIQYYAKQV